MRELYEACREAGLGYPGERVSLEGGEALLRIVFTTVTRHDFPAQVRPPGPEPVADYIRSMFATRLRDDSEAMVSDVIARLFPNGPASPATITTHAGCLVCR